MKILYELSWLPFLKVSRQAAKQFEKQFDYAVQHYFALQEERMVDVNAKQL